MVLQCHARELRFGIFTLPMLVRLIFSTPGLVMWAPKHLMVKFEPNIIFVRVQAPLPLKDLEGAEGVLRLA